MKALKKIFLSNHFWVIAFFWISFQTNAQVDDELPENDSKGSVIGNIYLKDIQGIIDSYTYDPLTDRYIYTKSIDGFNIDYPVVMTRKEYEDLIMRRAMLEYFQKKQSAIDGTASEEELRDLLPRYYVNSNLFKSIFGSNTIELKPLGTVDVNLGMRYTKQDNPLISPRNRRTLTMDFDQKISLSMQGKIGTKLDVNINYDTQATFGAMQQLIKLDYQPDEDAIIQKIEVGNVSMPINNSLIRGAQSLFGVKTELQFGKTRITGVFSKQNSQSRTIVTEGGGLVEDFEFFALNYDADRHFFLSQYFRDKYDESLRNYPYIDSRVRITRVEVWVTNRQNRLANRDNNFRNILALQDLGETRLTNVPVDRTIGIDINNYPNFLIAPPNTPTANANNQFNPDAIGTNFLNASIRDVNTAAAGFNIPVTEGRDFVKLENAKKLSPSEFKFHPQLGYISLNQKMSNDEVVAVAYEYSMGDKIYRVGEFGTDGIDATVIGQDQDGQDIPTSQNLILKLLKSSLTSTEEPVWNLMMKNIYHIPNAQNLSSDGFRLNILHTDPQPLNYISPAGSTPLPADVANTPLLSVFNLDRLNSSNDPEQGGDGFFDFVSSAYTDPFASQNNSNPYNNNSNNNQSSNTIEGITIDAQKGLLMFTSVEPFGEYLFKKLAANAGEDYNIDASYNDNQRKYVYKSLYRQSYSKAEQDAVKNKFQMKGKYRSESGGINIGMNVPQGSVVITAGGRTLAEGIDFVVDYQSGRVDILDPSLADSSTPINVTVESNSLFAANRRTFFGTHIEHTFNEKVSLGGTFLRLSETPLTIKSGYGNESVNNTMVGLNFNYNSEAPFLTRLVNKLPNIDTDVPSNISFKTEFAYLIPGNSKVDQMNGEATSYIDDFEGTRTNIDISSPNSWHLSSVPIGYGAELTGISTGFRRSKLSWYSIDQIFHSSSRRPNGITENDVSSNKTRRIYKEELFPTLDIATGENLTIHTLDLTYYPKERGPYNYNPDYIPTNSFQNPENNFGGIMRAVSSTNFERSNIEYLEFWLMDPYTGNANDVADLNNVGELSLNFGYISEDILQDGLKQYENGLPGATGQGATISSIWGKVPASTALIYAFDTDPGNRAIQDAGLDGILDDQEAAMFPQFAYLADPAADNYEYFLSASGNILQRYKNYNGLQGNSPVSFSENERGAKNLPDVEDIDGDNTMNTINAYFEYKVKVEPNPTIGSNYVVDVQTTTAQLTNGGSTPVKWVQYKVPISDLPEFAVGPISDLQSIRFMRMYVTGFTDEVTLRFGSLNLVQSNWRRYQEPLYEDPNLVILGTNTGFDVTTLNIIENFAREPIPYVLPPGLVRERVNQNNSIINENEQSLSLRVYKQSESVTSTNGLEPGDSRAVFKAVNVDMRQYKKIRMFLHAEALEPPTFSDRLKDDEMVAFIRFGNDFTDNFYQVEIPLKTTEWYTSSPDEIWKLANEIELQLDLLTKLKIEKNKDPNYDSRFIYFKSEDELDPSLATKINKLRIGVKGNPNFGLVRNMMLGVRNNTDVLYANTGQPRDIRGDVWFNELRLSDMDKKGGWAAVTALDAKIADFASINATAIKSTTGFGSIEQGPQERSREDVFQYNITTAVNINQLLPKKWNLNIPLSYSISEETITPEFDPNNPDTRLKVMMDEASTKSERDAIKERAVDYTKRTSINLIGVRKQRGQDQKERFYDIENFSVSQSFNQVKHRNFEIEGMTDQQTRTSIDYAYSFKPYSIEPFKNAKELKKKQNFKILTDFNLNPLPTNITFNTNVIRQYNKQKYRSLDVQGIEIKPLYKRNYNFNYNYGLNFNLSKSLSLSYLASVNNIVRNFRDENGIVNNELGIWDGYFDAGDANARMQQLKLNYKLPINKIPALSFLDSDYSYTGDYNWQRSSDAFSNIDYQGVNYQLGNLIQNANTHRLSTTLTMEKLYKYVGLVPSSQRKKKPIQKQQQQAPKPGEKIERNKVVDNKKNEESKAKEFLDVLVGIATSVKTIKINYNETNGTALPGFLPGLGFFGSAKPTVGFLFGSQADIRYEAARRGYLSLYPEFNQEFSQVNTKKIDYNAVLRPIPDLIINLKGDRQYSRNLSEQFDVSEGFYNSRSPYQYGNFSISTILIKTAFNTSTVDFSETFNTFRSNRIIVANRLAVERGIDITDPVNIDEYGYPKGYGRTNQEVLIPAFLAAYMGDDPASVKKGIFRDFPLPNWDLTYQGLTRIPWIKERFSNFRIKHAYQSVYTVNSYQTNYDYQIDPNTINQVGNYPSATVVSNINLAEQFRPLVGIDFKTKSDFQFNASVNKERLLSMSFDNNLLTEVQGYEYVFGFGFRIKDVTFNTEIDGAPNGGTIVSDLVINADFNWRKSTTIIRYLDYENNIIGAGSDTWRINLSAEYQFSKNITGAFYYNHDFSKAVISTAFPVTNIRSGFSVRYNFGN